MNLTFRLRYATQPGQSLWLAGQPPLPAQSPLHFLDRESWQTTISLAAAKTALNYSYLLRNPDGSHRSDWGRDRQLVPADFNCSELLVIDSWNDASSPENAFYTEPFKKVLLAKNFTAVKTVAPKKPTHTFRVKAPLLAHGQTLCLLGEGSVLGNWQTQSPLLLSREADADYFTAQLDLRAQTFPFAYKYGIFDAQKKNVSPF